jgi:hypothetical protein
MTTANSKTSPRRFLRFIAMAVLASAVLPNRADAQKPDNAPAAERLSVAEARKLFVCKTHMSFSAGHGTQISYLRSDNIEVLWYPGNAVLVRGRWRIAEHANEPPGGYADICFQYGTSSYNPVTGRTGGEWECRPAHVYARSMVEHSDGDVFGLANRTAVPFTLSREKTTIDDLRKKARRPTSSNAAQPSLNRDRGCDEESVRLYVPQIEQAD